ncbi:LacI family transcriptional regulator [Agrobacterium vitis]|nr:LacI family transcriptional regulator [Agrobacterium vitis]MBE1436365.1 LacI family transcriptional regulator [Agrobacterium vitis]
MSVTPAPKQTINLGDIARALGVSVATVSNALSGKGRVSASLVPRIREMADAMGYVPSQAARALRTGKSGVLGLVLPDIASPLFPQIAQAIEHAASGAGYGILIADSRGDVTLQTEAINRLIERGVDGLIIVPRRGTRIAAMDIPYAVIDSPSTPGNTVSADHWQGGALVGAHLAALGHQAIMLIGNNPASNVQNDRIGGIRSMLSASAQVEVLWIEQHDATYGAGALLGLADKFNRGVTAFAAVSDLHALRAMTELHRANIRVPEDATVIGFDDLFWAAAITPALTTVRMDMPRIADIAIASLVNKIEGKQEETPHRNARVPMSLVVRQTCGPTPSTLHQQS